MSTIYSEIIERMINKADKKENSDKWAKEVKGTVESINKEFKNISSNNYSIATIQNLVRLYRRGNELISQMVMKDLGSNYPYHGVLLVSSVCYIPSVLEEIESDVPEYAIENMKDSLAIATDDERNYIDRVLQKYFFEIMM